MNKKENPETDRKKNPENKYVKSKFPLRTVLLVPFLIQIICISGLVGYISYRNGQKAVNEVTGRLHHEINARINEYLKDFIETPVQIIRNNSVVISQGLISYQNQSLLEHFFWEQIQIYRSVSSIYFGSTNGGIANSGREAITGTSYRLGTDGFRSGKFRKFSVTTEGNRAKEIVSVSNFDSRVRPWYKAALSKEDVAWSNIYILFTGQDMAISASKTVYNSSRRLLGVVSVDLFLSDISSFLAGIDIGKTGLGFIIDSDGLLIADSTRETIITPKKDGEQQRRLKAGESSVHLIRSSSEKLIEEFGKFSGIRSDRHLEFYHDGERKFMHVAPMPNKYGLEWIIVTVIPESDFMEKINSNNRITILLIISALLLSLIIGYFTSLKIVEPVFMLKSFVKSLSAGKWPENPGESGIGEIDDLKESFFHMSGQMKDLIENLTIEIKERKLTEGALRESEEKYRELIQYSNSIILRLDNSGRITYANDYALNFFGYTHDELLWKNVVGTIVPKTDSAGRDLENMVNGIVTAPELYVRNENENIKKDGSIAWIVWSNRGIYDDDGRCVEVLAIGTDITERRLAEIEIKKLLNEKEILLHEVHHRIKNNMNTIAGLLYLQSVSIENESAVSALKDAHGRVLSMMLIYDKLFRSVDFSSISTGSYLPELINGITSTFPVSGNVRIETKIDDYKLDSNALVPMGIIINELLTNAYKYAFPAGRDGLIEISFLKTGDGEFELTFKDNGIGIPESILPGESSGFGLNLVHLLSQQMRGSAEIIRGNGTVFKIKLSV
jgi:PAS domain S-box-containing protein